MFCRDLLFVEQYERCEVMKSQEIKEEQEMQPPPKI